VAGGQWSGKCRGSLKKRKKLRRVRLTHQQWRVRRALRIFFLSPSSCLGTHISGRESAAHPAVSIIPSPGGVPQPEREKERTTRNKGANILSGKNCRRTCRRRDAFHFPALEKLVDTAKLRWRIERDYQELKQEIGLGHFEGRGWRGFHHHATLCIAAHGFLVAERSSFPPSAPDLRPAFALPQIPEGWQPRGSSSQAGAT
jgi:hypothetical protein